MTNTNSNEQQSQKLARANILLALVLGGIVLLTLFIMFHFWPSPQVPA